MTSSPPAAESTSSLSFTHILGQGRVNQLGGLFINGRPLPHNIRVKIVEMATQGIKPCQISRQLRVSHGAVSKILNRYAETGSISPGQMGGIRSRISVQMLEEQLMSLHTEHPQLSAAQLRQLLIDNEVCTRSSAPTATAISRYLRSRPASAPTRVRRERKRLSHSIDSILGNSIGGETSSSSNKSSSDEDSFVSCPNDSRRNRTAFTHDQLEALEKAFQVNKYPEAAQREALALETSLTEDKVMTWFSNRRARCRKNVPLIQHFLPHMIPQPQMMFPLEVPAHPPLQMIFPPNHPIFSSY